MFTTGADEDDNDFWSQPHIIAALTDNGISVDPLGDEDEQPRPEQGGTRITPAYLLGLSSRACRWEFRYSIYAYICKTRLTKLVSFDAPELLQVTAAFDLPPWFCTRGGYRVTALEAVALLCARFRTPANQYNLVAKYDRSQSAISEIINTVVVMLDERWKHLLDFDDEVLLSPANLAKYANAIHAQGSPLRSVWGFIDCTIRQICRPSYGQRAAYNGHKKFHALKYQAVMLANGIIAHLFGPWEGRRADPILLAESGLLDKCERFAVQPGANNETPLEARQFQLFGDPAYGCTHLIQSPFAGPGNRTEDQATWNAKMSAVCIEVEHGFGVVVNLWPFLNTSRKHRVFSSPVGRYYRVGVLLTNASNCCYPNQVAQYFDCMPPTLEEYFHD